MKQKTLKTTREVTFSYEGIDEIAEAEGSTSFLAYSLSKERIAAHPPGTFSSTGLAKSMTCYRFAMQVVINSA